MTTRGYNFIRSITISTAALACVFVFLSGPAVAGHMFLEYRGELTPGYTFYRGSFDLGDINRDGADEMVIADDEGGYHVYRYTHAGFVPMWISDPIVHDGFIASVEILHENVAGIQPHIFLLDSLGTLHQIRYTGYLFEETAHYENYRPPGESGRLMITDIGSGGRTVLIAVSNGSTASSGGDTPSEWWKGMTIYRLTAGGLVELTDTELDEIQEGEVYFVRELKESDISSLLGLNEGIHGMFPGSGPDSGSAGLADLDQDALVELLLSVSDPNRPIDRLEIYKEEDGAYTVRVTIELPLINEMVLGDIDGDSFPEIVGLTYDGVVLVYQWDPLTILLPDGSELDWEAPHKEIDGVIWMSLGGFESLGCEADDEPGDLKLNRGDLTVEMDRTDGVIRCGNEVIVPDVPAEVLESVPYLPLFSTLDCLGFLYTYDPVTHVLRMESSG